MRRVKPSTKKSMKTYKIRHYNNSYHVTIPPFFMVDNDAKAGEFLTLKCRGNKIEIEYPEYNKEVESCAQEESQANIKGKTEC